MQKLILIGGGSLAIEVISFFTDGSLNLNTEHNQIAYVLDENGGRSEDTRKICSTVKFIRSITEISSPQNCRAIICVGDPNLRMRLFKRFDGMFASWAKLIHRSAVIMPSAQIGEGAIIAPNTYVGPLAKIGPNVLVNVGASIGHDADIGHSSVISPQAAINGFASCGVATFIGAAATMNPGSSLGAYCKLSSGSVFSGKADEGFLLHGNPAKGRQMFRVE